VQTESLCKSLVDPTCSRATAEVRCVGPAALRTGTSTICHLERFRAGHGQRPADPEQQMRTRRFLAVWIRKCRWQCMSFCHRY
jgi:hypothetical protein